MRPRSRSLRPVWALLVFVVALAWPPLATPAGAQISVRVYRGGAQLVKTPNREQVWVIEGGRRHWVVDGAAFAARGFRWQDVSLIPPAALRTLPVGTALHGGPMLREEATGHVYVIADGHARLVPDPLSFREYGLEWGRVRDAAGDDLTRYPRDAVLPHAVTGQIFPAPPAATAFLSGAPSRAPSDPRLLEALELVRQYPPTATWPDFLDRFGVALSVSAVTGGIAAYRPTERTIVVDPAYAGADSRALASVIAHETLHAIADASQQSGASRRACIDEEVRAFGAQAALWAHHWGSTGRPEAATELEQQLNHALLAIADEALSELIVGAAGYSLHC